MRTIVPKRLLPHPLVFLSTIGLPFGLCNAPAIFQRLMQGCLSDMLFEILLVYLDDVILFSSTIDEHIERLDVVLSRLKKNGLKLRPEKCNFFQKKIKFLGHEISSSGIATDPDKIKAVVEWPTPTNVKDLRSFLGFASYYRKFVKNFSKLAGPLHDLVNHCINHENAKSPPRFKELWDEKCQSAFEVLKTCLVKTPILGFADYTKPFILEVDASKQGLGAVLSQEQDGSRRVIAYASRRLHGSETNMLN